MDDATQALPLMQELEGVVDLSEGVVVGDVFVDFYLLHFQARE